MNGCRGGSATATGRGSAGAPRNTGSEAALGPSGMGAGGTASAGPAARSEPGEDDRGERAAHAPDPGDQPTSFSTCGDSAAGEVRGGGGPGAR